MPNLYTQFAATEATDQADGLEANSEVLASEATEHTVEETGHAKETGAAVLGIDPLAIALQAGTFLILFFIIRKYALAKIVQNLSDRRQTIEEGLKNAHEIETQKEKLEKDNEVIARDARKAADSVIALSHEEAGAIVSEAQARANKQAEEIVQKAKAQAQLEQEKARKELKSELLGLVSAATETVLDEKIDGAKDQELIERSIRTQSA